MLYLIEGFMRGDNDLPLRCLKIGYTKDIDERMRVYKTYNPSIKLLKTREGELDLEKYLHKYFKKYELLDFNEWFIYSERIVENFEIINIQEDTITVDEYLECIREEILHKLIPETYKEVFSKIPELLMNLEIEFNEGLYNSDFYSSFPKDLCEKRIKNVLRILRTRELEYFNDVDFSDIRMDFPQIMGRQRLKENAFKDECVFIYKLSDKEITLEEYDKLSKEKLFQSSNDVKHYEVLLNSNTGNFCIEKMIKDLRLRIRVQKYSEDYTGINEKTGAPQINKLVYIAERRAFELRSDVYKSEALVYNGFGRISTDSVDFFQEKTECIERARQVFELTTYFHLKMKIICDLLLDPEWYGHIHVSDFHWLPIKYRNILNLIGAERVRANGHIESSVKKEINHLSKCSSIGSELLLRLVIGNRYTLKELKSLVGLVYRILDISKTPKATDILDYFEVKECLITEKDLGKRVKGYEIIKIKD